MTADQIDLDYQAAQLDLEARELAAGDSRLAYGPVVAKTALVHWVHTGRVPALEGKAALVENATGEIIVPQDLVVEVTSPARDASLLRPLVTVRPTRRHKQQVGLLSAAAVGWGKLETGGTLPDANIQPSGPSVVEVHDLVTKLDFGVDELDDTPAAAGEAITDALAEAVGETEDAAIAAGTGTGQPRGLATAVTAGSVPAGQITTAAVNATPTVADLRGLPWKLPARYRRNARWFMSTDAAQAIAALVDGSGNLIMPEPGPNGRGLFGWPVEVVPGLPAMTPPTALTEPSVIFADPRAAYRLVDRRRMTITRLVQRYADLGRVGLIVRHRVGGDVMRPAAVAAYKL
jgi:HK97 family phage major capsid protein